MTLDPSVLRLGAYREILKIMKVTIFETRIFCGENAAGNSARCYVLPRPISRARAARLSANFLQAVCFCWWRRGALHVRCFQRGKVVKFCGHGILASASVWNFLQLKTTGNSEGFSLRNGRRHLQFFTRNGYGWFRTERMRCVRQELTEFMAAQCHPQPIAMAVAGGPRGYKIFEWCAGTDIAKVRIESSLLLCDQRATILTAAAPITAALADYDYTLRYLAPQYGIEEDVATGSANVVLTDYWVGRGLATPFNVCQCSPAGGLIFSDVDNGQVAIGGGVNMHLVTDDLLLATSSRS